jgi:hypothetical protein
VKILQRLNDVEIKMPGINIFTHVTPPKKREVVMYLTVRETEEWRTLNEQSTTFSTLSRNGLFSGIDVISIDLFSFSAATRLLLSATLSLSLGSVDKVVADRNCPNQWEKRKRVEKEKRNK